MPACFSQGLGECYSPFGEQAGRCSFPLGSVWPASWLRLFSLLFCIFVLHLPSLKSSIVFAFIYDSLPFYSSECSVFSFLLVFYVFPVFFFFQIYLVYLKELQRQRD